MIHRVMWAVMGLMGPMITCRELNEFLSRYVEEDLTAKERRAFDRHVAMCRACRDYVDSYVRTIELEGVAFADPSGPVPDDVPEELVQGILAARRAAG
ncbi:MAG: zf-HC2 domain-containing protein [Deltaproteobacteria bacterium]|nr:zf-HC2 domain-containing protein [Deltaproteobacteria bacterium]